MTGTTDPVDATVLLVPDCRIHGVIGMPLRAVRLRGVGEPSVTSPDILLLGNGLKMRGIEAGAVAAQVVDVQASRLRAVPQFIRQVVAVEPLRLPVDRSAADAVAIDLGPLPDPALVRTVKERTEPLEKVHSRFHSHKIPKLIGWVNPRGSCGS